MIDKGFTMNMLEADDESQLNKLAKGLGLESRCRSWQLMLSLAPLLTLGGFGWSAAI